MGTPLTASADRSAPVPIGTAERLDRIAAALRSLEGERRRLERLGLEWPLARCHQERRYWEFLRAMHAIAAGEPDAGANA